MKNIALAKWDAVELFLRMIAKFEGKKDDPEYLRMPVKAIREKLNIYAKRKECISISNFIFGRENDRKTVFPVFCQKILAGDQVVLLQENFRIFKQYIDDDNFANDRKFEPKAVELSNSTRKLENTAWLFYYYNEEFISENRSLKLSGVSRSTLFLKSFGKAELRLPADTDNESRIYVGFYDVTEDYKSLYLDLKCQNRDLKIEFYTSDHFNFALGVALNKTDHIFAKRIIIEKTKEENALPQFFDNYSEQIKLLPKYILQFLESKEENFIQLPKSRFYNASEFDIYLNSQEKKGS